MVTRRNGQITANRPKMLGLFTEEFSVTLLSRKNGRAMCDSPLVRSEHAACSVGSAFVTKPSAQRHSMGMLKQPFVLSNWTGEM
jgi:hypothetical protein